MKNEKVNTAVNSIELTPICENENQSKILADVFIHYLCEIGASAPFTETELMNIQACYFNAQRGIIENR